jgi:site-specific recombinase XerC
MKVIGKSKTWREDNYLTPPKQYTPNKNPLTVKEVKRMFKATEFDYKENALLKVFYYGLLRRSEVENLNVLDVDFQRNKLDINEAKGNNYAKINLHPDGIESIRKYLKVRKTKNPKEKALFLNRYGKRIAHTEITNTLKRIAIKVGIKNRYIHIYSEYQV